MNLIGRQTNFTKMPNIHFLWNICVNHLEKEICKFYNLKGYFESDHLLYSNLDLPGDFFLYAGYFVQKCKNCKNLKNKLRE